jgi:hypothetical protein
MGARSAYFSFVVYLNAGKMKIWIKKQHHITKKVSLQEWHQAVVAGHLFK